MGYLLTRVLCKRPANHVSNFGEERTRDIISDNGHKFVNGVFEVELVFTSTKSIHQSFVFFLLFFFSSFVVVAWTQ